MTTDPSPPGTPAGTLRALDDPSWAAYAQAVLHFAHAGTRWSLDLRADVPAALMAHTLATLDVPAFAVLTACNPRGRPEVYDLMAGRSGGCV